MEKKRGGRKAKPKEFGGQGLHKFCLGERVWACQTWDRAMSPLGEAMEGEVVYVDPQGRWVTVQGRRYRESFWAGTVHRRGEPGQGPA